MTAIRRELVEAAKADLTSGMPGFIAFDFMMDAAAEETDGDNGE